MKEIKNYRLDVFLTRHPEVIETYANILKHLDPIPTKKRIIQLNLEEVETIKQKINDQQHLPEIFRYMDGKKEREFKRMRVTEFYGKMNYIINQLENLYAMEKYHLTSNHTDFKWEAVEGSKRLSKLGIYPLVDNLAGGDILKFDDIMKMPYETVFNKLRLDVLKGDIQKDMEKVKTIKG